MPVGRRMGARVRGSARSTGEALSGDRLGSCGVGAGSWRWRWNDCPGDSRRP